MQQVVSNFSKYLEVPITPEVKQTSE